MSCLGSDRLFDVAVVPHVIERQRCFRCKLRIALKPLLQIVENRYRDHWQIKVQRIIDVQPVEVLQLLGWQLVQLNGDVVCGGNEEPRIEATAAPRRSDGAGQQPQMRQPTPKQQPKPAQKPSTQSPRYPLSAVGTTGTPGVTTREAVILTRKSKQAIKEEIEMYVVLTIIVISRGSVELCSDNYFFLRVLSSTLSGSLNRISHVDITTPFQNVMDACKRLLPFHIFHEVTDEELDWDAKVQFQKRVDAVSLQPYKVLLELNLKRSIVIFREK